MPFVNGEVALRKWMMDIDTLVCNGKRGSEDLGKLVNGDCTTFGALIWCGKVHRPHFATPDGL